MFRLASPPRPPRHFRSNPSAEEEKLFENSLAQLGDMDGEDPFMAFNAATIPGKNMIGLKRRFSCCRRMSRTSRAAASAAALRKRRARLCGRRRDRRFRRARRARRRGDRRRRERERPDRQEKHKAPAAKTSEQERRKGIGRGGAPPVFVGAENSARATGAPSRHSTWFSRTPTQVASHAQKYFIPAQLHEQEGQAAEQHTRHHQRRRRREREQRGRRRSNPRTRRRDAKRDAKHDAKRGAYYVRNGYVAAPGMMPSYAQQSHM